MADFSVNYSFVTAVFILMAGLVFLLQHKILKLRARVRVFEDSVDAPSHGLIFFDKDDRFFMANKQASLYLPFIYRKDKKLKSELKMLNDFLGYMFDHAVDCDEGLRSALGKAISDGFREVIRWEEDRLCLAEVRNTAGGRKVLVLRDLSDIKRNEDSFIQLNRHNFELTEAVEAATNGIMVASGSKEVGFNIVYVNNAFSESTGLSKSDILNTDIRRFLKPFIGEEKARNVDGALDQALPIDFECKIEGMQDARWFDFRLTPVIDAAGQARLFVGVCTETTALKQREAEFFHVQKLEALGKLAAGVAHDFNNVLSIIDGYSHIASRSLEDGNTTKDYLNKIRNASARGADLTKKMLTFSRHKIVVESVIELGVTLKDQEVLLQPLVEASINFVFQSQEQDIFIESTPDSITQIVMNLVVNARDAMPEGGELIVEARKVERSQMSEAAQKELEGDSFACLSVSDTGQGMDRATLDHIFDPFFTTKGQGKGTGLGLSMVYGLVTQMGGTIDVQTALNQGTTFYIYFPLSSKRPQKAIEGNMQDIESISLKGYTALIAEDEPELLNLVGGMLEKLGMEVITASNGNEALLKQDEHIGEIDLLLTDVVMPELDGVRLAEMFSSLRPDSKIIFMSGYPAGEKLSHIELPEKTLFVAKPIRYESLVQIIFQTLSGDQTLLPDNATPHWETSDVVQKVKES